MKQARRERVFIVRMWSYDEAPVEAGWRGSVRDVLAERTVYVVDATEVAEFIATALAKEARE